MADPRNIAVTVSLSVAVLATAWALYSSRGGEPAPGLTAGESREVASPGGGARASTGSASQGSTQAEGAIPVVTSEVRRERISGSVSALGTARANEAVEVTSKTSNLVTGVHFRDGQRVRRGQVLVELDSAQAQADLAEAEAARAESVSQFNRSRELLATRALSESQFEQLEAQMKANTARVAAANARLKDTVIRAPFDGVVGLRRVSVGSLVSPGTVITTLDDTSVMKVDFAVPENTLARLRPGLAVTAESAAYPGEKFTGEVASVDSRVDPVSRSVTVRALVPNPDGRLKPGMFLSVRITVDEREALLIPEAALVPEQNRQFVFVVSAGRAERREVRIGTREPGRVEILSGLEAGERIVVEGTQKIRDGVRLRELPAPAP